MLFSMSQGSILTILQLDNLENFTGSQRLSDFQNFFLLGGGSNSRLSQLSSAKVEMRLINPGKSDFGNISKKILDRVNAAIRSATVAKQWTSTKGSS